MELQQWVSRSVLPGEPEARRRAARKGSTTTFAETHLRTGASVMGKRMFDARAAWPADAPFHTPVSS